jgi:VanZ family protein
LLVLTRIVFAFAVIGTIWLSLIPLSDLPSAASMSDVVSHLIGYAALGALAIASGFRPFIAFLLLFILGTSLEVLQGISGYRYFEFKDIAFNTLGIFIGIAAAVFVIRALQARRAHT